MDLLWNRALKKQEGEQGHNTGEHKKRQRSVGFVIEGEDIEELHRQRQQSNNIPHHHSSEDFQFSSPAEFPPLHNQNATGDAVSANESQVLIHDKEDVVARHSRLSESLSMRLLQVEDDPEEEERLIMAALDLNESDDHPTGGSGEENEEIMRSSSLEMMAGRRPSYQKQQRPSAYMRPGEEPGKKKVSTKQFFCALFGIATVVIGLIALLISLGTKFIGPPYQPVGPYKLIERQEGMDFFNYYNFYEGRDSLGSNGYNYYVSKETAKQLGIMNVTIEDDVEDVYTDEQTQENKVDKEPFIYMSSLFNKEREGRRDAIRLEGKRRFNRGLFILDLRHMPAGCGVWPAFWLTDEANWPVNGEIDIVEGVNYQSVAKTALHTTRGCTMEDAPVGVSTGKWDTAIGVPDKDTGIPNMNLTYAKDCFVYNPHQWLNQGCVVEDQQGGTIGVPLNKNGGGVYVLEWDPIYRRIRSWVFTPHTEVPKNLKDAIRTASYSNADKRIMPNPDSWHKLPYAYYAIGDNTDCPASHFANMRLVFNLAFCGQVAGNRYHIDCHNSTISKYKTCNEYLQSDPKEIREEAYWKIRGVYVYDREWDKAWV